MSQTCLTLAHISHVLP
ncbi:hypothetical protein F383_23296 [Gossypium arboreum]|uniref:Uncharacterized protein n=1 Tax=Gossypium arboreum TaxID=29729 RepID=A0A0B0NZ46_GOSAR|nr:hypothetical protein F383_23296 [Gossypium arboreum]